MRLHFIIPFWVLVFSCNNSSQKTSEPTESFMEPFSFFDKENHLQPLFDRHRFDSLHGWDLGWALLEPINISKNDDDEIALSKKLSPGQKALYFIWYLDAEVTNGGFIQFYWNNYRKYIPPILDGLELIGDPTMIQLVKKADKEFLLHKDKFTFQQSKEDWEPLYDQLKNFDIYDSIYYKEHDNTMHLIEQYARKNPQDFVKLK